MSKGALTKRKATPDREAGSEVIKRATRLMRRELRTAFTVGFFLNLLVLASPLYMLQIFDRVLATGHSETLLYLTLIVIFALAVFGALEAFRSRVLSRLGFALEGMLRDVAIRAWLKTSLSSGAARYPAVTDLQALRGFLQGPAPIAICDAPWAPLFMVVLFLLHPLIGLIGLAAAIIIIIIACINERVSRSSITEAQADRAQAMDLGHSVASNADTISAMGMIGNVRERYGKMADRAVLSELRGLDRSTMLVATTKAFRIMVQVCVLGTGAWLVLSNELTAGGMIGGSILLGRALAPAEQSIGAWRSFVPAREAWRRLKTTIGALPPAAASVELPAPEGAMTVENVGLDAGQDQPPILDGISFSLEPGELCVVLGPTGAGKSSLCRILVGAQASSRGKVRLDEAEMFTWNETERGKYVGYLPQDVDVFCGTIAENICRLSEPESETVIETSKLAGVYSLVMRTPDAFETRVGPGGLRLSGGQKQRLGLARALYKDPHLVVLDEPNSNLDQDGERALMAAIEKMKARGAVIVVVAHKGNLVKQADKILLLRDGKQDGFGDRHSLIRVLESQRRVVNMPETRPANLTTKGTGE